MFTWKALMSSVVVGTATLGAMAQDAAPPGGGGGGGRGGQPRQMQQLSPEKAKAAWELQAKSVASGLGLNADQTKAVVKAYTDARASHRAAGEKLREEAMQRMRENQGDPAEGGGGGRGRGQGDMRQKMEELNTAERTKLQKALGASLNQEQSTKAMVTLGSFNPQWDTMTSALAGLGLEQKKLDEAMKATNAYMVSTIKARESDDPQAMRETMQEARQKLNDSLKKTLGDEGFAKYEEAMPRARGGQGGGRGGEGGPGGGGRPPRRGGDGGGGAGGGGGGGAGR